MAMFGLRKKKDKRIIDLTERYRKQQERTENMRREMQENSDSKSSGSSESSGEMFSIFGGATPSSEGMPLETDSESSSDSLATPEERRRRLTKRLLDMTNKIEEMSNQLYHLTQRIEVLERKVKVSGAE